MLLSNAPMMLAQLAWPAPMGGVTLFHYLFIAACLFAMGVIGFLSRRNLIVMFLCTELMFQGAGLALIALLLAKCLPKTSHSRLMKSGLAS